MAVLSISLVVGFSTFGVPLVTHALRGIVNDQGKEIPGLIPCTGDEDPKNADYSPCTFASLQRLIMNVMYYLIYISIPAAALSFGWAGWLLISSGGNMSKRNEAKRIFTKVGIGLVIILTAWLIVHTITSALLKPEFVPPQSQG